MKVWIYKYAFTRGVFETDAEEVIGRGNRRYVRSKAPFFLFTTKWSRTQAEAQGLAELMRLARIRSIKRQLAKLKTLRFV